MPELTIRTGRKPSGKRGYVDKEELYDEFMKYYIAKNMNAHIGRPKPPLPDSIGKAIIDIANGISKSPSFSNYTYRDEMIGDSIEICVRYVSNFDPLKYDNVFGYITKIVSHAFVNRIKKEKRQHYYKMKSIEHFSGCAADFINPDGSINEGEYNIQSDVYNDFMSQVSEYERKHIESYEKSVKKQKRSKTRENLSVYIGD